MANAALISKKKESLKSLISRCPDGQIDDVVSGLIELLKHDESLVNLVTSYLEQFNKEHFLVHYMPSTPLPVLITKYNEIRNNWFCFPSKNILVKYNHRSKVVVGCTILDPDKEVERWRGVMEDYCTNYIRKVCQNGACNVFGSRQNGVVVLTVCIAHHVQQKELFYNGCWRSAWTVTIDANSTVQVDGAITIEAHYFENGSAYLINHHKADTEFHAETEFKAAAEFVRFLDAEEEACQQNIMGTFDDISLVFLKELRRHSSIRNVRVDWDLDKIRAVKQMIHRP